ncbi:MAG: hypothetical protein ACLFTR_03385 [Candidatus Woesearchaeota archaeon]
MKISVRITDEHEIQHEWLKDALGLRGQFGEDSQVIKRAETIAFNVLQALGISKIDDIFTLKSRDYLQQERGKQYERMSKGRTLRS